MAFVVSNPVYNSVPGDARLLAIPFTNGGADTGGVITTPFKTIIAAWIQCYGPVVAANQTRITAPLQTALPAVQSTVTIVTDADVDGVLFVLGK